MVKPFEARNLPELAVTAESRRLFTDLIVAVQGAAFLSDTANNIGYALRWLRDNPEAAKVLLGSGE